MFPFQISIFLSSHLSIAWTISLVNMSVQPLARDRLEFMFAWNFTLKAVWLWNQSWSKCKRNFQNKCLHNVCKTPSDERTQFNLIICATVPAMTLTCFRWLSAVGVLLLYHHQRAGLVNGFLDSKLVRFKHNSNTKEFTFDSEKDGSADVVVLVVDQHSELTGVDSLMESVHDRDLKPAVVLPEGALVAPPKASGPRVLSMRQQVGTLRRLTLRFYGGSTPLKNTTTSRFDSWCFSSLTLAQLISLSVLLKSSNEGHMMVLLCPIKAKKG